MIALQHLYNTSPSIQAARAILMGQLLSSGVVVRREGRDVNLKSTFSRHLEDVWVPFARTVVDHFLMFGFVCVSLEREAPPPFANFIKGKQMAATSQMGPREDGRYASQREPPTDSEARAQAAIRAIRRSASPPQDGEQRQPADGARHRPVRALVHPHGQTNYVRQYALCDQPDNAQARSPFASNPLLTATPGARVVRGAIIHGGAGARLLRWPA